MNRGFTYLRGMRLKSLPITNAPVAIKVVVIYIKSVVMKRMLSLRARWNMKFSIGPHKGLELTRYCSLGGRCETAISSLLFNFM